MIQIAPFCVVFSNGGRFEMRGPNTSLAEDGNRMSRRFLVLMASLILVDLGITGIFIAVSGRLSVFGGDLLLNLALFGGLNVAGAYLLFRPVQAFLSGTGAHEAAEARIGALPWLAAAWAAACTLGYCFAAFSIGVFVPDPDALAGIPDSTLLAGLLWFGAVYAVYYAFYIYFIVSDFTHGLKLRLFADGLVFRSGRARIVHKLVVVFLVTAFLSSLLIAADLSVFRVLRAAQGLTVEQTILLDLVASAFLIAVSLVFVTRSLVRPIDALTGAMETVGAGRLGVQAPVMTRDELGVLAERFNEMQEGLRDREFIRETFGRYVPQTVVSSLLEHRGVLEPQLRSATILFADIENFTAIAESHPPETVMRMLNEYFSAAIEPINRAGGVVNQFQGDAMLVTFNLPVADPLHADKAVAAAIEMQREVAGRTFAGISVRIRVGIHTGEVIAGAVGSGERMSYTVHGDAVNLAARLETLNRELGTRVLVSGETVNQLEGDYPLEAVGSVEVRGKSKPVSVYKLTA